MQPTIWQRITNSPQVWGALTVLINALMVAANTIFVPATYQNIVSGIIVALNGLNVAVGSAIVGQQIEQMKQTNAQVKAAITMSDAIGRMQDATVALQKVLFKVNTHNVGERRNQP